MLPRGPVPELLLELLLQPEPELRRVLSLLRELEPERVRPQVL